MPPTIIGVIIIGVLILLFAFAANKFHNSQLKLEQHVLNGDIAPYVLNKAIVPPAIGDEFIFLNLKRKHFEKAVYVLPWDCAICNAVKELFPEHTYLAVTPEDVIVEDYRKKTIRYNIYHLTDSGKYVDGYYSTQFNQDKAFADNSMNIDNDTIIRKIKLVRV